MRQSIVPTAVLCVGLVGCTPATRPAPPPSAPPTASAQPELPLKPIDGNTNEYAADDELGQHQIRRLEVPILAKSGSALIGKAELTELDRGVSVVIRIDRVAPGLHGVHIHEVADCSAPDAASAGGHFNPEDNRHALPSSRERHLGDLGNIVVKTPDGEGRLEITVAGANLEPGSPMSFLNRSLVVHSDYDRGAQPSGEAGDRIGCAELTARAARREPLGEIVTN